MVQQHNVRGKKIIKKQKEFLVSIDYSESTDTLFFVLLILTGNRNKHIFNRFLLLTPDSYNHKKN